MEQETFISTKIKEAADRFGLDLNKLSIEDFLGVNEIVDGVYWIKTGNLPICILVKHVSAKNTGIGLLSFAGALSKSAREKDIVPNFAGIQLSEKFKLPFVAIADPSIFLSKKLILSWYAGSRELRLQDVLPEIIQKISMVLSIKFLAFGGSGGGFAALYYAKKCAAIENVFVWNPQTSIVKYYERFWRDFAKVCFEKIVVDADRFLDLMNEYNVETNICNYKINDDKHVVYIQNRSDWHTESHAMPFIRENLVREGDFSYRNKNIDLFIGDWGDGHVVPPKYLIEKVIFLMINRDFDSIERVVQMETQNYMSNKVKTRENESMVVGISKIDSKIIINCSCNQEKANMAIYLKNDNFTKKFPYSEKEFVVELEDLREYSQIVVFKKDEVGNVEYKKIRIEDILGASKSSNIYSLKTIVRGRRIFAAIETDAIEDTQFAFYIMKEGVVIYRRNYTAQANIEYDLSEVGLYNVVGFVKSKINNKIIYEKGPPFKYDPVELSGIFKLYKFIMHGDFHELKRKGWIPRADVKPINILDGIPWRHSDRNIEVSLQSFRFLSPVWSSLSRENDSVYFDKSKEIILNWLNHLSSSPAKNIWYDMAVGIRSQHISLFLKLAKFYPINNFEIKKILEVAKLHVQKLADPNRLGYGNHALYQLIGLACLMDALETEDLNIKNYVNQTLKKILQDSFDENFINVENSPFYHNYNLWLIKSIPAELFKENAELIETIVKHGEENTPWLTSPAGHFYNIGDSEGRGPMLSKKYLSDFDINQKKYIYKDFFGSGYQIIRTSPDIGEQYEYLVFHATNKSKIHAHIDQLSFVYGTQGFDLVVDSGKYTYEYGDWRSYFQGSRGHNSVGVKGVDLTVDDINYDQLGMHPLVVDNYSNLFLLSGFSSNKYFKHARKIMYRPSTDLCLVDSIEPNMDFMAGKIVEVRLNFSSQIDIEECSRGFLIKKDGREIGVVNFESLQNLTFSLYRGELNPINGWLSESYHVKNPVWVIAAEIQAESAINLTTKFTFFSV